MPRTMEETDCLPTLGRRCTPKTWVSPTERRRLAQDAAALAVSDWSGDRARDMAVSSLRACTNYRADHQLRCSPGIAAVGLEEEAFRELVWAYAVVQMVNGGMWVELTCDLDYSKEDEFSNRAA